MLTLDPDLLRTFVCVADTRSFTAAGSVLGATQSAVSMRIKKLEERLDRALLERTPRAVALTRFGEAFLADARRLLAIHDDIAGRALNHEDAGPVSLGVSDHAAGAHLPEVLARLKASVPGLQLRVHVGSSEDLAERFERGHFQGVVVRKEADRAGGVPLFRDRLAWMAAPDFAWSKSDPLPLLALAAPCRVRDVAAQALDAAGIAWVEAFAGGGVAAVQAAVSAGLGIACLDLRNKPTAARTLGRKESLPSLPESDIVLMRRAGPPALERVLDCVARAFSSLGRIAAA